MKRIQKMVMFLCGLNAAVAGISIWVGTVWLTLLAIINAIVLVRIGELTSHV